MARIAGPTDLDMPRVHVNDVEVFLPVDLPEGGQVQVVIGESPLAPASLLIDLAPGTMLGMLGPATVDTHMPKLKAEDSIRGFALVRLPNMSLYGLPMVGPHWLPTGGFLNVRIGTNANAMPVPSTPLARGTLLFGIPQEPSAIFRQGIRRAEANAKGQNPYAIVPGTNGAR